MNWPIDLPGFPAIAGGFPTPVELAARNVLPDHALQDLSAVRPNPFTLQNHLPIFEFANKVEIATLIVNPRLLPLIRPCIERGKARATHGHAVAARKVFLDDAAVHDPFDQVCAVVYFIGFLARPGEVPFPDPEFELLLLRNCAGIFGARLAGSEGLEDGKREQGGDYFCHSQSKLETGGARKR